MQWAIIDDNPPGFRRPHTFKMDAAGQAGTARVPPPPPPRARVSNETTAAEAAAAETASPGHTGSEARVRTPCRRCTDPAPQEDKIQEGGEAGGGDKGETATERHGRLGRPVRGEDEAGGGGWIVVEKG